MAFERKSKYSRKTYTGQRMRHEGGFREKDIMDNAAFVIGNRKNYSVTFYKKHKKEGRYDSTKYDKATYRFPTRNRRGGWVN